MSENISPETPAVETPATPAPAVDTPTPMVTDDVAIVESPATYANGKYQSVGELESAYTELQSTFSKKMGAFSGAPEAYEFPEGSIDPSNQPLADMLGEWGKENQMSNDGINGLIGKYSEFQATQKEAAINDEFAKLGDDAAVRIDNAKNFLEANLGNEATSALAANMNTAAAIEAIEKLITMSKTPGVAPAQGSPNLSKDAIREMRFAVDDNGRRKIEDPAYREKVLKLESGLQ